MLSLLTLLRTEPTQRIAFNRNRLEDAEFFQRLREAEDLVEKNQARILVHPENPRWAEDVAFFVVELLRPGAA